MSDSASELLTARQVVSALLARPALRKVAATCVLPAVRHGSEWRYRKSDLDEWIARHDSPRTQEAGTCSLS